MRLRQVGSLFYLNRLLLETFVLFAGAGQEEGVGVRGLALGHGGDHIGTLQPMGLGQIGRGPLRRVVWMGVVKARNSQTPGARLALDLDQFQRSDLVAVVRRVGAGVASADSRFNLPTVGRGLAQERASALMGVRLLAMGADLAENRRGQSKNPHASSQNLSVRYFSALSGSTVTMTALRPAAASSRAMRTQTSTAAAAEMPTSRPSSRASRRAIS